MKTLHLFLIKRYIPPFLGTLFIAVFVFFMVFVFTYIDEIAGKGVDSRTLAQLFMYTFLTFIPGSMPLAVLLSSIMTFGNLGENYELASLKSAGMSLLTIMKPLLVFIVFLSVFCFVFSNYTLPFIHLKSGRLLYDVREAKPTLNIKESIFYNGIEGYSIRVGKKEQDGKTIRNITIYDHTERKGNVVQIYADSGKLEMSPGRDYLNMTLYNGHRYQQILNEPAHYRTRPMMSLSFKEQLVTFDLSSFKMQKTDEELFKNNAEMMNISQLNKALDTLKKEKEKFNAGINNQFVKYFNSGAYKQSNKSDSLNKKYIASAEFLTTIDEQNRQQIVENAINLAKSSKSYLDSKIEEKENKLKDKARYEVNWHSKITLSVACIILFFVGAPLGAIVRKGGLGMPVVISVLLFIVYHSISFSCQKMVLQGKMPAFPGMWIGTLLFLPVGIWLSVKASKDSSVFEIGNYTQNIKKFFARFNKANS